MQCDDSTGCYEDWESTCELEADGGCMACRESAHSNALVLCELRVNAGGCLPPLTTLNAAMHRQS